MIEMASDTNRKIKQNQLGVSAAEGSIASLRQETESAANDFPLNTFVFSREDAQGGVFGSVQTAAWKVKIDYQTVDGNPVGKVSIYNPVLYSSGVRVTVANASVADWNDISDLVKLPLTDGGTLVCRIKMAITKTTDSNGEESVRKWIHDASLFFLTGESSEEEPEDEEWHDIAICTFFAGANAIMPFKQLHTGALTFTGEIVAGGGGAAVNPEDFNIYITKIGEEIWLTQGQKTTTTTSGTTYEPIRKVLRLDDLLYKAVISNFTDPGCSKEFCAVAALPMCFGDSLGKVDGQGQVNVDVFGDTWKPAEACILLRGYETSWMKHLCAEYPTSETDQGFLKGSSASGLFFSTEEPTSATEGEIYFYTELMDTNVAGATYAST